jgi:hypothetical protein
MRVPAGDPHEPELWASTWQQRRESLGKPWSGRWGSPGGPGPGRISLFFTAKNDGFHGIWMAFIYEKAGFLMGFLEFKHETWEDHGMMGGFG